MIQEVVDRPGFGSGSPQNLIVLMEDDGSADYRIFMWPVDNHGYDATLTIEYGPMETDISWHIQEVGQATQDISWYIYNGMRTSVSWHIFNQIVQAISWHIYQKVTDTTDTSWHILDGFNTHISWDILMKVTGEIFLKNHLPLEGAIDFVNSLQIQLAQDFELRNKINELILNQVHLLKNRINQTEPAEGIIKFKNRLLNTSDGVNYQDFYFDPTHTG